MEEGLKMPEGMHALPGVFNTLQPDLSTRWVQAGLVFLSPVSPEQNNVLMKGTKDTLLLATPAHLWDGVRQLPGSLELWENEVVFRFSSFKDSHLNLTIPLMDIESVEEYLVYDLARNGLRIQSKIGRCDLFVVEEEGHEFKKATLAQAKNCLGKVFETFRRKV